MALLSLAFFCTAQSWQSSCHSEADKLWQAERFPQGISSHLASAINNHSMSAGSSQVRQVLASQPCIPWCLQTDRTAQHASLMPQPSQAKDPSYQIRILQTFSKRTHFFLLSPDLQLACYIPTYSIFIQMSEGFLGKSPDKLRRTQVNLWDERSVKESSFAQARSRFCCSKLWNSKSKLSNIKCQVIYINWD